jgi:arsenate reductase
MAHVLFVCLHNAGRSQMSQALFERGAQGRHSAASAGTQPAERVHPEVVVAMRELDIDIADRSPRALDREMAERADVVVTMGCGDECPYIPGKRYIDWDLEDPSGRPVEQVRRIRDDIAGRVAELISELDAPPLVVEVEYEERYWYPDEGGQVWLAGYYLVDPSSGRYLARDAPELAARGLRVVGVAGAGQHHADAVATDAAAPGRPLELMRDLANPHDANAIAVHGHGGGEQLGWVPREVAAELAPELDAGRSWSAVVLREQCQSPRDPRHGLTMLLAPASSIELRVRSGEARR